MRLAVLGLGKAGSSLVASCDAAGVDVVAKARRLPQLLRARGLAKAEVLALAVPDDAIEHVAAELAQHLAPPAANRNAASRVHAPRNLLVVHLSGAKGPSALAALSSAAAARVGCFHPLASLDGKRPIPAGTLVAVDALDARDVRTLSSLARTIGCRPARVAEEKRALYHAGAVVAGNLPVALLAMGVALLVDAGVPEDLARESLARLLESQARNAIDRELSAALTGPVARGDAGTLATHLAALARDHAEIAGIYRALSRTLVNDVARHGVTKRRALTRALARAGTVRR